MTNVLPLPGFEEPVDAPELGAGDVEPARRWRLEFRAEGRPQTKGSARAFTIKRRDGSFGAGVAHGNTRQEERLAVWENAVRTAAMLALGDLEMTHRPIGVRVIFRVARPEGHFGSGRNAGKLKSSAPALPCVTPDIDKILRSTLDGMIGTAYADDRQVCDLDVKKRYADERNPIGASIVVEEL